MNKLEETLEIDAERFEEVWRLSTYIIGSMVLDIEISFRRIFGLKPSEHLIFRIVATANVQRHMREHRQLTRRTMDVVPTAETNFTISRRRVADASGLPRETVRRLVTGLIRKGLIKEDTRGALYVPIGLIRGGRFNFGPDDALGPAVRMTEQLLRLGVLKPASTRRRRGGA